MFRLIIDYTDGSERELVFHTKTEALWYLNMEGDHVKSYRIIKE